MFGKLYLLFAFIVKNFSWNVRGVGYNGFVQQIHKFVSLYNPNIIFYVETKINSDKAKG